MNNPSRKRKEKREKNPESHSLCPHANAVRRRSPWPPTHTTTLSPLPVAKKKKQDHPAARRTDVTAETASNPEAMHRKTGRDVRLTAGHTSPGSDSSLVPAVAAFFLHLVSSGRTPARGLQEPVLSRTPLLVSFRADSHCVAVASACVS